MHWKALGLAEKSMRFYKDVWYILALMLTYLDTNNWQKLIIDTLSHSPHLFVTGAHIVAKYVK
jgi:hypothetical protein